jgi:transcriptional regulator with GAF, ATPase, and Fis domain
VSTARTVIFLSHTCELRELPTKRSFVAAAEAACVRAGLAFTDMAYFTARDTSPAQYCIDEVSSADVYVGIIGFRYGSPVRDRPDVSYTELEFEVATEHGLRRLIFMLDESADLPPGAVRDLEHGLRQEQFRRRLLEAGLTIAMVNGPEELEIRLLQALTEPQQDRRSSRGGPLSIELKQMAEARRRLQRSVELTLEVGRSLEPDQVMDMFMVRLTTTMEADQATLLRVDEQDLVAEATHRPGADMGTSTHRRFPLGLVERVPALARVLATGDPAVGGRLEAAPGAEELVQALPTGVHTLILPYAVDGRMARVFVLGRDDDRPFEHADIADLVALADVAMLALDNAGRHAAAEGAIRVASSHLGHLAQAIEAAEEIGSADLLSDVVERARLLAVSALRADRGNISRLEGDELVVEHDHRPLLPYPRRRPLSRSRITAEAIRTRRPVHGPVAEGSVGPDGLAWMVPAGLRYAIQCPMIVGGEVVGVLGLGRSRDEPFTDAEGEALLPFAKLVGLLLQNARRLAEARRIGQAKSQFMALAAHELRTPLAAIRAYLSLLEDGTYPVPDRTRAEVVETLVSKAQDLESLVDSLVMAARLEGRSLPLANGASPSGPVAAK